MFAGNQGDYTFVSSEDGLTVTVTDRSTGDVDTVTNVETLSFDDGDIGVSHDGTGLVLTGQSTDSIEVVGPVGVTVLGEAGNDTLTGGDGNDTIDGGEGDDTLTGGLGDDVIIASDGSDTVSVSSGSGVLTVEAASQMSVSANEEAFNTLLNHASSIETAVRSEALSQGASLTASVTNELYTYEDALASDVGTLVTDSETALSTSVQDVQAQEAVLSEKTDLLQASEAAVDTTSSNLASLITTQLSDAQAAHEAAVELLAALQVEEAALEIEALDETSDEASDDTVTITEDDDVALEEDAAELSDADEPLLDETVTITEEDVAALEEEASNWSELSEAATELEAAYQTLVEDLISDTATARDTYDGVIGELGASLSEADAQYHGQLPVFKDTYLETLGVLSEQFENAIEAASTSFDGSVTEAQNVFQGVKASTSEALYMALEASRAVENQAIEEANEIYRGSNSATAEEERREAIDAAQLVKAAADTSAYDTYNEAVSSAYEVLTSTTSTLRSGFEDAVAAIEGDYQTELTSALDQYQSDVSEAETQYAETLETVTSQYASALSSYQSSIQGLQSTFTGSISSAFTEFSTAYSTFGTPLEATSEALASQYSAFADAAEDFVTNSSETSQAELDLVSLSQASSLLTHQLASAESLSSYWSNAVSGTADDLGNMQSTVEGLQLTALEALNVLQEVTIEVENRIEAAEDANSILAQTAVESDQHDHLEIGTEYSLIAGEVDAETGDMTLSLEDADGDTHSVTIEDHQTDGLDSIRVDHGTGTGDGR